VRILIITDWQKLQGGAEAYIVGLRNRLIAAGDEVELLTSSVSPVARQVADHVTFASDGLLAKSVLQIANPFAVATVRRVTREFKPDLVIVNMFSLYLSPAPVLALGKIPFVLILSDYKCICPMGHRILPDGSVCNQKVGLACYRSDCLSLPHWFRDQPRYALIRRVLKQAARVISVGSAMQSMLQQQGVSSIPLPLFSPEPGKSYRRDCADDPLFLFLGRLDAEKGVDTLIRAFARLRVDVPNSRLRIVGRGILRDSLERLAAELGQKNAIEFCGWMESDQVELEISRAWALVAPSRWVEPFGLVALEALLRGVPAIVTDAGGLSEQVKHGVTGLVCPIDDVEALCKNMLLIATGQAFAEHQLKPEHVAEVRRTYNVDSHLSQLRTLLKETILRDHQSV
jgi:glycosyltransferase involved in cell wall biosynthesis